MNIAQRIKDVEKEMSKGMEYSKNNFACKDSHEFLENANKIFHGKNTTTLYDEYLMKEWQLLTECQKEIEEKEKLLLQAGDIISGMNEELTIRFRKAHEEFKRRLKEIDLYKLLPKGEVWNYSADELLWKVEEALHLELDKLSQEMFK
jgi:hypothetical protein